MRGLHDDNRGEAAYQVEISGGAVGDKREVEPSSGDEEQAARCDSQSPGGGARGSGRSGGTWIHPSGTAPAEVIEAERVQHPATLIHCRCG